MARILHGRRRTTPNSSRSAAGALILAASLVMSAAVPAAAVTVPPVKQATRIADQSYPGIQLISANYTATVAVPEATVDDAALQALTVRLEREVISGAIEASEAAIMDALVDEISKDPTKYFKPTSSMRTTKASVGYVGTGWVITPDGYIITAAHVVSADDNELVQAFAETALQQFVAQDIKDLQSGQGSNFSSGQVQKLSKAIEAWDAKYLRLGDVQQQLSAQIGVAVPGFGKGQKGKPVEVVSKGEPYPKKDVAILKIDGVSHLPTLPVGKDADVVEGSTLYVAGYTGASTFYAGMSADSEVQPAVTEGPLTAIKSNPAGVPYFQTQAPAGHGNSGGPVMDEKGNVVGILVAGSIDPSTGETVQGQQWVLPISVVQEKLNQSNVKPAVSDSSALYNVALESYYKHHYKKALPKFQQVANLYPGHPYVQDFITKSQSAINSGQDKTPSGTGGLILIGVAVLFGLLVIGAVVLLLVRRKGRRQAVAPQPAYAMSGMPAGPDAAAYPPQGYPQPGPSQQAYPPQGQPQAYQQPAYPQQGPPPQGYPQQGPPPQGYPQQAPPPQAPAQAYPAQTAPQPVYPPQAPPPQAPPQPAYPQPAYPQPAYPQPAYPPPGQPEQGYPTQAPPPGYPAPPAYPASPAPQGPPPQAPPPQAPPPQAPPEASPVPPAPPAPQIPAQAPGEQAGADGQPAVPPPDGQ